VRYRNVRAFKLWLASLVRIGVKITSLGLGSIRTLRGWAVHSPASLRECTRVWGDRNWRAIVGPRRVRGMRRCECRGGRKVNMRRK
jgi:hypothetical protein